MPDKAWSCCPEQWFSIQISEISTRRQSWMSCSNGDARCILRQILVIQSSHTWPQQRSSVAFVTDRHELVVLGQSLVPVVDVHPHVETARRAVQAVRALQARLFAALVPAVKQQSLLLLVRLAALLASVLIITRHRLPRFLPRSPWWLLHGDVLALDQVVEQNVWKSNRAIGQGCGGLGGHCADGSW